MKTTPPKRVNIYFPIKGLAKLLFPHVPLAVFQTGNDPYKPVDSEVFTKDDYACFSTGEDTVITSVGTYRKNRESSHAGPTNPGILRYKHARFLCYELVINSKSDKVINEIRFNS